MRTLFFKTTLLFFITSFSFAQKEGVRNAVERNNYTKVFSRGQSFTFLGGAKMAKGSLYLNERWEGRAMIITKDKKKIIFKSINFNTDTQVFESKMKNDSTYLMSFDNIEYIIMNNKKFKELNYKGNKKVFEYIYESPSVSLLKTYSLSVKAGSVNPMVNRPEDVYTIRNEFYSLVNGKWDKIKLSRNQILKILEKQNINSDKVKAFAKSNNLSFNDEFQLKTIMNHFL